MTSVPPPTQQQLQPQQQQQVGAPAPGTAPPEPAPAPTPPAQTPAQGLPPTGIDQQLATVNAQTTLQPQVAQAQAAPAAGGAAPATTTPTGGATSIQALAQNLAQQLGLPIGRGKLVDDQGNFLMTPDQVALAGGARPGYGGLGQAMSTTAAKMGFISSAIANEQNRQQQRKGIAAISTGLGQVQKRGRGSLASMQSGLYQDLADLYSNQEYEAADFSYFIQQGMMNEAATRAHRARKSARKIARYQLIGSIVGGVAGAAI